MAEIRIEVPDDELAILDGYCAARGNGRTDVFRKLLKEWSEAKRHEAIMICRVAGINPVASESDRSPSGKGRR